MVSVPTTAPSQTGSLRWRGMWPAGVILLLVILGAVARPPSRKSRPRVVGDLSSCWEPLRSRSPGGPVAAEERLRA
jgi:hypothetical protein